MILSRIKELCSARGTTIKQLEAATGIANGVIRKWDASSPRLEYVVKVANYFGVSVDYLLGQEGSQGGPQIPEDVMRLAALYEKLSPDDQASVMALANHMATKK